MAKAKFPKSKVHKIVVRNRKGTKSQVSHGAVTEVLLDGKRLPGLTSFSYSVEARNIGVVTLTMLADVKIESNLPDEHISLVKKTIAQALVDRSRGPSCSGCNSVPCEESASRRPPHDHPSTSPYNLSSATSLASLKRKAGTKE